MNKEFFRNLENILYEQDLRLKFETFFDFYDDFKRELFIFDHEYKAVLKDNIHPNLSVKKPMKIRRVSKINSNEALAKMLHSIAHIEYSAINLALDSSYRFHGLDLSFYRDFLKIADDEIKHFKLLQRALSELGFEYGDFAVHDNLEAALKATANSLKYRMSVVHRGLEARGLDANPFVVKKLQSTKHALKTFLEEILNTILEDEITHVSMGDIWWKASKDEKESFIQICEKFKEFSLAGKVLNTEARLKAGFDEDELKELESFYHNRGF
ncbi:DUF455 domain-containing protein [Campylobacter sp. MIT 12-5580]|uniref:ferritin-like domain-containing protein n=1 Tax=Campylobacter sp. MIT 12-5580 TaxID=2040651 RepID=UPI0010FA2E3C|nr:ferritin-like domain-containing protein [Campylobacter sp. MIT 12-5580]TKX30355.1 DUF455 domain-containing protein [Campylobacter sp. MIT 12-5580]